MFDEYAWDLLSFGFAGPGREPHDQEPGDTDIDPSTVIRVTMPASEGARDLISQRSTGRTKAAVRCRVPIAGAPELGSR